MRSKKVMALLLVFVLALSLVACGGDGKTEKTNSGNQSENGQVEEAKALKFGGDLSGVGNLDLHLTTINEIFQVSTHIQESLLGLDAETLEVFPQLLTKMPEISEDGKTYSCELKPDIKFHDGTTLTSSDVKFTFERIFDPETKNVNTWLCDMICGGKEMLNGEATELSGFKLIDDTHFEISIEEPYSPFISVLAASQMAIYPEKACKEAGDKWGTEVYIGTGPYKLKEFSPKNKVVLDKFEDYHGGAKNLDEIAFLNMDPNTALLEFENGGIDVTLLETSLVDSYLNNEEFKDNVKECHPLGIIAATLNTKMAPLDNIKVREALSYAVDREGLTKNYLRGKAMPAKCFLPKGIPGYDENAAPFEYNTEKAKKLLKEAGYPNGIEITSVISEESKFAGVLTVLQEQLKQVGVTLNIQKVDHAGYIDLRSRGEIQVPILNWYADIVDPDNFLYNIYYSENSKFFSSNYKNEEFDKMCEEGRLIVDLEEKNELYKKADYKIVHEDFTVLPLYNPVMYYMVSDKIEGAVMMDTSLFRFYDAKVVD